MRKKIFLSILLFLCVQMLSAEVVGDFNGDNVIELSEVIELIIEWESRTCLSEFISANRFCERNFPVRVNDVNYAISIWKGESIIKSIGSNGVKVVFTNYDEEFKEIGVARVYFTDMNKEELYSYACWYAGEIIRIATEEGYQVIKSEANMAKEIQAHIWLYNNAPDDPLDILRWLDHSLPIDIELHTGRWMKPLPIDIDWDEIIKITCD